MGNMDVDEGDGDPEDDEGDDEGALRYDYDLCPFSTVHQSRRRKCGDPALTPSRCAHSISLCCTVRRPSVRSSRTYSLRSSIELTYALCVALTRVIQPGQELEYDSTAYDMLHKMSLEWSCLSFDIIRDSLGIQRTVVCILTIACLLEWMRIPK